MSFQIRAVPAEDSALGREIARKLQDAANDILVGVPAEQYGRYVGYYTALLELMAFMDERRAQSEKGDPIVDD